LLAMLFEDGEAHDKVLCIGNGAMARLGVGIGATGAPWAKINPGRVKSEASALRGGEMWELEGGRREFGGRGAVLLTRKRAFR
jgi:hypothetical protein